MRRFRRRPLWLILLYGGTLVFTISDKGFTAPAAINRHDSIFVAEQQSVLSLDDRLIDAAFAGQIETVRDLLSAGAKVDARHSATGLTALMEASGKGHLEVVKLLIESGADVNASVNWKKAEHHDVAVKYWKAERYTQLPSLPNQKVLRVYGDGWTALMAAAEGGHIEIVKHLLKSGAKVNTFVYAHWTTKSIGIIGPEEDDRLHTYSRIAARRHPIADGKFSQNHLTRVQPEIGSDDSSEWDSDGLPKDRKEASQPPAKGRMFSFATGRYDDEGSIPESVKVDPLECWTALMAATERGFTDIMKLLIEEGANVHAKCECGDALALAVENNQLGAIRLLIREGANANTKDRLGDTPLHIAIESGNAEVIKLLLQAGANVDAKDRLGDTPLLVAIQKENVEIIKLLLQEGANPNISANNKQMALRKAFDSENSEIIKILLRAKASFGEPTEEGYTALMKAVELGNIEITRVILQTKPNINQQNQDGDTALMLAVSSDRTELVRLLFEVGANVNIENKDGETALSLATEPEIVRLFRAHMTRGKSKK